jgi:hypothetical protein
MHTRQQQLCGHAFLGSFSRRPLHVRQRGQTVKHENYQPHRFDRELHQQIAEESVSQRYVSARTMAGIRRVPSPRLTASNAAEAPEPSRGMSYRCQSRLCVSLTYNSRSATTQILTQFLGNLFELRPGFLTDIGNRGCNPIVCISRKSCVLPNTLQRQNHTGDRRFRSNHFDLNLLAFPQFDRPNWLKDSVPKDGANRHSSLVLSECLN